MTSDLFENINGTIRPRDVCARKHGGNEQSIEAFRTTLKNLTRNQRLIYDMIVYHPRTVEELADSIGTTRSGRKTVKRLRYGLKRLL